MLGSRVKNKIMSQRGRAGIVTHNKRSGMSNLKFKKKRLNPSHTFVLSLSAVSLNLATTDCFVDH